MTPARGARGGRFIRARRGLAVAGSILLLASSGCPPRDGPVFEPPRDIEARDTSAIVETINANAARLDHPLWSAGISAYALLTDKDGREHSYNLEGTLLFQSPRNLRVDLRPGLGERVMGLGSNDETFWLWIEPELRLMRWGRHRNAGLPCCEEMPVRPDQLLSALALTGLPGAEEGMYGPVRDFGKTYDVLTYHRGAPRFDCRKYYVERVPPYMVRLVRIKDERGRDVMSAFLDDFRPAWEDGPLVPHAVSVFWPAEGGRLTITAASYAKKSPGEVSPRAFRLPDRDALPAGIERIIQIDAACERASP